MGFISVLVINNDAYGAIDQDPVGWWTAARYALEQSANGEVVGFSFDRYAGYFNAVHCAPGSTSALIAVGGGCAPERLWSGEGAEHHSPEGQLEILGKAAQELGYHLVRDTKSTLVRKLTRANQEMVLWGDVRRAKWVKRQRARILYLQKLLTE